MKKLVFIISIMSLISFHGLYAEPALFINSIPGRAGIEINGSLIANKTPALLRNLLPGTYLIELSKPGYKIVQMKINLKDNEVNILTLNLEYQYIPMLFPVYENVQINGLTNNRDMLLLKNGEYNFSLDSELLNITPTYPGQRLINGLNISIPLMAAFSGALTVNEIYNPKDSEGSLSVFTLSSLGVSAALIIADILLYIGRNKFYREFTPPAVTIESEYPESLYKTAEEMFAAGKVDTALFYLNKIVSQFPDSDIYPDTLYKTAKIKIINGEIDSAHDLLNTLIEDYPVPGLYNYAEKSLSDIYLRQGLYQESLDHLNLILFMESGFTREEIDLQRYKVLKKWYETDQGVYSKLKSHINYMLDTYSDSSFFESYERILSEISP